MHCILQLLEIARGFGPVRAYHFVLAADGNHQSAFLEVCI